MIDNRDSIDTNTIFIVAGLIMVFCLVYFTKTSTNYVKLDIGLPIKAIDALKKLLGY